MKKNNSFSRIKKYKSNYANSIIEEQKKIYTINIQLDSDCKNEINKNLKNFKSNKITQSKTISITNNNEESKKINEKIKKN